MSEQFAVKGYVSMKRTELGMARFFTPANVERYRLLASPTISPDQRRKIIAALANEMKDFKAE